MSADEPGRRQPVGAEVLPDGDVHFRVWAPLRKQVEVVLEGGNTEELQEDTRAESLKPDRNGYFSGRVKGAHTGKLYRFRLDGGHGLYPDPASRFQLAGPHGSSQ